MCRCRDSNVVAYISFFDTINNTERKLYQPVYGDFKTSTAYLFDLSGNSITLTYADSNKTRTELEDLLVDCCGCVGGDGTVTSFQRVIYPFIYNKCCNSYNDAGTIIQSYQIKPVPGFRACCSGTGTAPSYVTIKSYCVQWIGDT